MSAPMSLCRFGCLAITVLLLVFVATVQAELFTIGSNTSSGFSASNRGQSFTPSVPGQGSGSSGTEDTVCLQSIEFKFWSGATYPSTLYIYDSWPATVDDLNAGTGALFGSTGHAGDTYFFSGVTLARTSQYYALFDGPAQIYYDSGGHNYYPGGSRIYVMSHNPNLLNDVWSSDTEFTGTLNTIPEPSTLILAVLGLFGIAMYGWRRR